MKSLRTGKNLLRRANSGITRDFSVPAAAAAPVWHAHASKTTQNALSYYTPSTVTVTTTTTYAQQRRPFSHSPAAGAKKNKSKLHSGAAVDPARRNDAVPGATFDPKNPGATTESFTFDELEAAWARVDDFHADKLKQLRAGGRFNPDVIGRLPVRMTHHHHDDQPASPKAKQASKEQQQQQQPPAGGAVVPLDQLAMVVPQGGRTIEIRLHEASSKKAVMSAVQASPDFNQQPQADPDNELVLLLRIQPESGDVQARRVKDVCHEWREQVRAAGQRRHKAHAKWKKDKAVTPDDAHRLDKELQKLLDGKMQMIDKAEKEALRQVSASLKSF